MNYIKENYTNEEESILRNYFTNIDKPVFALINLPDVVKGALFARYSRSDKSLRRLFLDEFYDAKNDAIHTFNNEAGIKRATELYDKMILNFGDDSVAQLGGAHIACEQVSNILTKVLERSRLCSYLEQSTRYIYYDKKVDGQYLYTIPSEFDRYEHGQTMKEHYIKHCDKLFDTYSVLLNKLIPQLERDNPKDNGVSDVVWKSSIKGKACDALRGLLPASTKSNLGIYASGQSFEYLLINMFADPREEVREYATMIYEELNKVIPSFLTRVKRPNRGVEWSEYIKRKNLNSQQVAFTQTQCVKSNLDRRPVVIMNSSDEYVSTLTTLASAIAFEYNRNGTSYHNIYKAMEDKDDSHKVFLINTYLGDRKNRRHKPGRAFEFIDYTFSVMSDYGAFRDLQRHRMLTIEWPMITPYNSFTTPNVLSKYPDICNAYTDALNDVTELYTSIENMAWGANVASYVVPFAYNIRYVIKMNLREALHLIELRTQPQGHESYRLIANRMFREIANLPGHSFINELGVFKYRDGRTENEIKLGRLNAAERAEEKIIKAKREDHTEQIMNMINDFNSCKDNCDISSRVNIDYAYGDNEVYTSSLTETSNTDCNNNLDFYITNMECKDNEFLIRMRNDFHNIMSIINIDKIISMSYSDNGDGAATWKIATSGNHDNEQMCVYSIVTGARAHKEDEDSTDDSVNEPIEMEEVTDVDGFIDKIMSFSSDDRYSVHVNYTFVKPPSDNYFQFIHSQALSHRELVNSITKTNNELVLNIDCNGVKKTAILDTRHIVFYENRDIKYSLYFGFYQNKEFSIDDALLTWNFYIVDKSTEPCHNSAVTV